GVRLAKIEGNPFHETVRESARRAGLRFCLNVVTDDRERVVAVAAGNPDAVLADLVAKAAALYTRPIPKQYDIAIAGVGHPKDVNLYQASRAATYLRFAPTPVVREGGAIIIPARLEEGAGEGAGEQRFLAALERAESLRRRRAARCHGRAHAPVVSDHRRGVGSAGDSSSREIARGRRCGRGPGHRVRAHRPAY